MWSQSGFCSHIAQPGYPFYHAPCRYVRSRPPRTPPPPSCVRKPARRSAVVDPVLGPSVCVRVWAERLSHGCARGTLFAPTRTSATHGAITHL